LKTLLLVRHAKALERDDFVADHDRALSPRGEQDAALMGAFMREQRLVPDQVLCSTAPRALRTWQLIAKELGVEVPVTVMRELYNAGTGGLFETIRRSGGAASSLLVVGHNPGMHALAVALSGSGDDETLDALRGKFPTGSLAVIGAEAASWLDLAPAHGTLVRFVRPKELKD
jgi:phosphohistidine phosphatase